MSNYMQNFARTLHMKINLKITYNTPSHDIDINEPIFAFTNHQSNKEVNFSFTFHSLLRRISAIRLRNN